MRIARECSHFAQDQLRVSLEIRGNPAVRLTGDRCRAVAGCEPTSVFKSMLSWMLAVSASERRL